MLTNNAKIPMSDEKKPDQHELRAIPSMTICRECDQLYAGVPDAFVGDLHDALLPCGHKVQGVLFSAATIKEGIKAMRVPASPMKTTRL